MKYYEKDKRKKIDTWLTTKLPDDKRYQSLLMEVAITRFTPVCEQPTDDGFTDLIEQADIPVGNRQIISRQISYSKRLSTDFFILHKQLIIQK